VLAKDSKDISMETALSNCRVSDQQNFDGIREQVDTWRESQLSDVAAKLIIYYAFIESRPPCQH